MGRNTMVLSVVLPGGPHRPEDVLASIRAAGGTAAESVSGSRRSFDITFGYDGDDEGAAAWDALCDVGAAFPGAVLAGAGG